MHRDRRIAVIERAFEAERADRRAETPARRASSLMKMRRQPKCVAPICQVCDSLCFSASRRRRRGAVGIDHTRHFFQLVIGITASISACRLLQPVRIVQVVSTLLEEALRTQLSPRAQPHSRKNFLRNCLRLLPKLFRFAEERLLLERFLDEAEQFLRRVRLADKMISAAFDRLMNSALPGNRAQFCVTPTISGFPAMDVILATLTCVWNANPFCARGEFCRCD